MRSKLAAAALVAAGTVAGLAGVASASPVSAGQTWAGQTWASPLPVGSPGVAVKLVGGVFHLPVFCTCPPPAR